MLCVTLAQQLSKGRWQKREMTFGMYEHIKHVPSSRAYIARADTLYERTDIIVGRVFNRNGKQSKVIQYALYYNYH